MSSPDAEQPGHEPATRWVKRGAAVVAIAAFGAGAWWFIASREDSGSNRSVSNQEAEPAPSNAPRVVRGTAQIEVGEQQWAIDITKCKVTADRITAQGDDEEGRTIVASFDRSTKEGSVTVSGPDASWAIGPAGGTEVEDIEVTASRLAGNGEFTRRAFGEPDEAGEDRPASGPERPTPGTFEIICE